ncbi:MAG: ABC transporter ATP-binding protein [Chitinophagaceae bacterium]|nr:ABC transporter ATP-binding protein [Chitinophagaceae bacterium]
MAENKNVFFDFGLLRRVFRYAAPYRKKFYWSVALAISLAIFTPIRPWLIQLTVNDYISAKPGTTFLNGKLDIAGMLILITIIQIGLILIETLMRFVFSFTTASLGQSVVKDLRVETYKKILNLNLSQFDKTPVGALTTRTISDIESVNDIFSDGLVPVIADLLTIFCVLVFMFYADWQLAFIALIPFPIIIVATYYFKESINKSFQRVRNAIAALNSFVQEHLSGMAVVQAFAAEENEFKKFKKINREHRNANIRGIMAYSIFFPVVEIVSALSIGLIVWYSSEHRIAAGTIMSFILYINLLFRPLRMLADKFNVLQMGIIASERVFKVLDNTDVADNSGTWRPQQVKGKIEFDKVWFAYDDENFVLQDVSFIARPGETVAIVGHTGSGKTTIISLLNRLYHIQKGDIRIDDVSVENFELDALRSKIGVVLQDVFLFSGSVMDNITLRNPNIEKEKVIEAAKMIEMHDFIMQLPGGYDYNVMERGATLSLGQRQLLSFIRAMLYNPSILILDEATSSVDTESEQLIQHAIDTVIKDRTSVIIAHRLSTIRKANRIIVLDKGKIIETGTHEELIQKGDFYSKLHKIQFDKSIRIL